MPRRTLNDFRQSASIRHPFFAWLMDRKGLYIGFALVSIICLGLLTGLGWNAYQSIISVPVVETPYQNVKAVDSPGTRWANSVIAVKPAGVPTWSVSDVKKPQQVIDSAWCNTGDQPSSLLSTRIGLAPKLETRVSVYGAGQARSAFDVLTTKLNECTPVEVTVDDMGAVGRFDQGFVMTMGDAIIGVHYTGNYDRDSLVSLYGDLMRSTLARTQCASLVVAASDSTRSFFYAPKNFTGLRDTTTVKTKVKTTAIPDPESSSLTLLDVAYPNAVAPEGPLPASFAAVPSAPNRPSFPDPVNDQIGFSAVGSYQVADSSGPGCGWAWSAQKPPVYDTAKLNAEKAKSIADAQAKADADASSYVNAKLSWALNVAKLMPQVDDWNTYVKTVDRIHGQWEGLNARREALRGPWDEYVAAHDEWITFDARKKDATTQYEDALGQCEDAQKAAQEWDDKWGELFAKQQEEANKPTPSPTPSATATKSGSENNKNKPTASPSPSPTASSTPMVNIPPRPADCQDVPEKPSIVDETKPEEPKPPVIPADTTIPDSWAKPQQG